VRLFVRSALAEYIVCLYVQHLCNIIVDLVIYIPITRTQLIMCLDTFMSTCIQQQMTVIKKFNTVYKYIPQTVVSSTCFIRHLVLCYTEI